MELIVKARKDIESKDNPNLLAIINCGFPESLHNNVAIDICNIFALESKMNWLGGAGIGGGGAIDGRPLSEVGNIKNIIQGLNLISECIINKNEIPKGVFYLLSKQFIPTWLYVNFGNIGWRLTAKKNKVKTSLFYKPY
ncbi:MAG: hypothetical protein APG12_00607 [Candidatus Methanofastidiosum methylothiophilum]|uniref:Uncharacterized protein n=1 Tax=Candidatus Methanofastidiosum methylothiophilum TaxID=1705564 RepID=A0A150J0R9_9EURY|nr:MAG: hypothetical protein APG10_00556 [Candidatus Methanofastidiosum methylthiophilus]KYC48005.1 MAG: hypothetical protein APG11_00675 [Candidatus Methanofastidiosum methylthiophilus]KYC50695.1 MAG: hypothetical protein APG12_00607 [Candidatus Methanofastidiosum methylthiophilus]